MIKPIPPEEFRRNYIETSAEYERVNMVLANAYNNKQSYAEMDIDLGSIPAYQDVIDYLGYKMIPAKGRLDEESLIRNELEIIIRPKIGVVDTL